MGAGHPHWLQDAPRRGVERRRAMGQSDVGSRGPEGVAMALGQGTRDAVREPAVAGRFYPSDGGELAEDVAALLAERPGGRPTAEPPRPAIGVLAPHAGYVYSGAVAGATFARVQVPDRVIVLCPNHTGAGERMALWPGGAWRTPLGTVPVDVSMADE